MSSTPSDPGADASRRNWLIGALVVFLVAFFVVVLVVALTRRDSGSSSATTEVSTTSPPSTERPSTTAAPTTAAPTTAAPTTAAPTTTAPTTAAPTTAAPTTAAPTTAPPTTVAPLPPGFSPASVTWTSLQRGIVLGWSPCAGGSCPSLALTTDGGAKWSTLGAVPALTGGGADAWRVRFADATNGWLFGPGILSTHDGGASWKAVAGLTSVSSLESGGGRVFAVEAGGAGSRLLGSPIAQDDFQPIGSGTSLAPTTPLAVHGSTAWVVAPDGTVLAASGTSLTPTSATCRIGVPADAGITVAGLTAPDPTHLVALCVGGAGAGSSQKVVNLSADSGATWTAGAPAPSSGQALGVAAGTPTDLVISAASGASFLYRSADSGATWATVFQDSGGGAPLVDLGFTDATHGSVVLRSSPGKLLRSTDGGATWSGVSFTG